MSGAGTTGTQQTLLWLQSLGPRSTSQNQTDLWSVSVALESKGRGLELQLLTDSNSGLIQRCGSGPKSINDFLISLTANGPSCLLAQHEQAYFYGDRVYTEASIELMDYCYHSDHLSKENRKEC